MVIYIKKWNLLESQRERPIYTVQYMLKFRVHAVAETPTGMASSPHFCIYCTYTYIVKVSLFFLLTLSSIIQVIILYLSSVHTYRTS